MTGLRIAAIRLACGDVEATAAFYTKAFGCRRRESGPRAEAKGAAALFLGDQLLELVPATVPAGERAPSNSTSFQHCAIVVTDMSSAMERLHRVAGWSAISCDGPERLPNASGGITAFKFRDPDDHPLEFLSFPPGGVPPAWRHRGRGPFLGIDHSAITVADTERSVVFYQSLGFKLTNQQTNRGAEQARMDAVPGAVVEVTGLCPPGGSPPHLELLCYREPGTREATVPAGDCRSTVLMMAVNAAMPGFEGLPCNAGDFAVDSGNALQGVSAGRDPDGHILAFITPE